MRKDGKWACYSINCCMFKEFKTFFEGITCYKDKAAKVSCSCGDD